MKRHPSLEPFSRDHNVGLNLARQALNAAEAAEAPRKETANAFVQYWNDELRDHFAEEERLLGPLISSPELRERLVSEHLEFAREVSRLGDGEIGSEIFQRAGTLLGDHIRWEERVLFPQIEKEATQEQLQELFEKTAALEARRSQSNWSPRRGELMKRREVQERNDIS